MIHRKPMIRWIPLLILMIIAISGCSSRASSSTAGIGTTYALKGGLWFDGSRFVERRVVYVENGLLTWRRPHRVDYTLDLTGTYVIPPFGDAHAHHFEYRQMVEMINRSNLEEGIFYGLSMTNFVSGKERVREEWNRLDTVDVAWADAGLTASFGHPIYIYEDIARGLFEFDKSATWMVEEPKAEGDGYFIIDRLEDLEDKWAEITASGPDLIKIFLLNGEEYEERKDDTRRLGDKGLDPRLVGPIVQRAHAEGLRVAAHVETAFDFRTAVEAGVDVIAHLPGYDIPKEADPSRYQLSPADAAEARRRGTSVVPTPLRSLEKDEHDEAAMVRARQVRQIQLRNIELLARHGVPLGAGTDTFRVTSTEHIEALRRTGLFTNRQLLTIWAVDTPRMIFPNRKIGRLEEGYEASLLALSADPLDDFSAVRSITLRMKQGQLLESP